MTEKIWAHSGDSHFLEPADLWHQILPKQQADRMPRTEMISDTEERVTVDGKSFTRAVPKIFTAKGSTGETIAEMSHRPPGSRDVHQRLRDLDEEGIWGEVMYQSTAGEATDGAGSTDGAGEAGPQPDAEEGEVIEAEYNAET